MCVKNTTLKKCLIFSVLQYLQKNIKLKGFFFGNLYKKDNTNKTTLMYLLCCNFNTNIYLIEICQKKILKLICVAF